jgi:hypothetical protein
MTVTSPKGQKQEKENNNNKMAASPYNFLTTIKHEINNPPFFLPTALCHQGEELIWTKPAYATYGGTPADRETNNSSFLCNRESTKLPPYMERILRTNPFANHQKKYIADF